MIEIENVNPIENDAAKQSKQKQQYDDEDLDAYDDDDEMASLADTNVNVCPSLACTLTIADCLKSITMSNAGGVSLHSTHALNEGRLAALNLANTSQTKVSSSRSTSEWQSFATAAANETGKSGGSSMPHMAYGTSDIDQSDDEDASSTVPGSEASQSEAASSTVSYKTVKASARSSQNVRIPFPLPERRS